ncbi:MAG: VWA domain-containing protein [Planctomycetes bacterium]|nr:VWA domain-containing protein [Planctomycetota bacterium]
MRSRSAAILVAIVAASVPLHAQDEPAVGQEQRVDSAIAAYRAIKVEAKTAAQRKKALLWLGEIDHARASEFLQQELVAAGDGAFAIAVVEAIGKVPRPALQPDLLAVLARKTAPLALRSAVVAAIARQGDRAVDLLVEQVQQPEDVGDPGRRDALVAGLVETRIDRALRGLAPTLLEGPFAQRLKVLRRLDGVHGVPPVSAARIKLVKEGDLELAACAWRQLAVEKHDRARALAIDVVERVIDTPKAAIAVDLIGGLVRARDADFWPLLLRYGSVPGAAVKQALRTAAAAAAEDPQLVQWLVTQGLDDPQPAARDAAQLLLASAPPEAVKPLVERLRADLRAGKKKALDQAAGLHELLAKDPSWRADLAAMATDDDPESRMLGLAMLLELGSDAGIVPAQQYLGHKSWELRSLSIRYLTRCRDVSSVPHLIARYGREEGRLASELDQALLVHCGTRCLSRKEWETWWAKHKTGFVLPHEQLVSRAAAGLAGSGSTIAYHDIPVVSSRLCFVVDRSGSMAEKIGTDKKTTRLDAAKDQLVRVVEKLPDTHLVNLIAYETGVQPLWDELQKLEPENRDKLLATARALPLGAGTNIFDALERAFADPKVDTIYLLTDGQPSAGRVRAPDEIVEEVRRWNRTRQIVVHCIGLGIDSDLLRQIAKETGGSYKYVR